MPGLSVELASYGNARLPVVVQVLDAGFATVAAKSVPTQTSEYFDVPNGDYVVRVVLPSGREIARSVTVEGLSPGRLEFDLHRLSPHETHEWAYLANSLADPRGASLEDEEYRATWARIWKRGAGGWEVVPFDAPWALNESSEACYELQTSRDQHLLQVGGPSVPWRLVSLPPGQEVRVLVRPAPGPRPHVHPLEVVVAAEDDANEALVGYLTSGTIAQAELVQKERAEHLLRHKISDPTSAAMGGYFLLRARAYDRLHSWANNLANWMKWMADGAIIHAWQLIAEAQRDPAARDRALTQARERLLEAVERGVPVYTEGMRLLRRGLRLLASRDRDDDVLRAALDTVNGYADALDESAATTTFTGRSPTEPSSAGPTGIPESGTGLAFVFDVPLAELVRAGHLPPGAALSLEIQIEEVTEETGHAAEDSGDGGGDEGGEEGEMATAAVEFHRRSVKRVRRQVSANVTAEGRVALADGTLCDDLDAAFQHLGAAAAGDVWSTIRAPDGTPLAELRDALRRGLRKA